MYSYQSWICGTWINLRRLSNTYFYCKPELDFIPDRPDLKHQLMPIPGSPHHLILCLTTPKVRKHSMLCEINLLSRKLDWLFPLLPLVAVRITDQASPAFPTGRLLSHESAWFLLLDWTILKPSAFPHRLGFHNFWQCFALLWVASTFSI